MEIYNYLGNKFYIFEEDIDQDMLMNFIKDLHKQYPLYNYYGWIDASGKFSSHLLYNEIKERYQKYGYLILELEYDNCKYNLYQNSANNFSNTYTEYQKSKLKGTETMINKIEELISNYEISIL